MTNLINIDKKDWEYTSLDTDAFLSAITEKVENAEVDKLEGWIQENDSELLGIVEKLENAEYVMTESDNTYNNENALSHDFVYSLIKPIDCDEWYYSDASIYIVIQKHISGDIRGNYKGIELLKFDDSEEAKLAMFDFVIGWQLTDLDDNEIDNSELCQIGYASNPTYELEKLLDGAEVTYSDQENAFLSKIDGKQVKFYAYNYAEFL